MDIENTLTKLRDIEQSHNKCTQREIERNIQYFFDALYQISMRSIKYNGMYELRYSFPHDFSKFNNYCNIEQVCDFMRNYLSYKNNGPSIFAKEYTIFNKFREASQREFKKDGLVFNLVLHFTTKENVIEVIVQKEESRKKFLGIF